MGKLKNKTIISVIILVVIIVIVLSIAKVKTNKEEAAPWDTAEALADIGPIRDKAVEFLPRHKKGFVEEIGGFSTDGRTFYFSSDRNNPGTQGDIFSYSTETKKITPLITDTGNKQILAWSPRTGKIIYSRDLDSTNINESYGYSDIFIADINSLKSELLFSDSSPLKPWPQSAMTFSPQGDKIAFPAIITGEKGWSSHIFDLNTRKTKRLGDKPKNAGKLSWSPDSKYIAYSTSSDQIYIVSLEDGSIKNLGVEGKGPVWSPSGEWIAFIRQTGKTVDIYITPSSGGKVIQITQGDGMFPHWSPDGKKIIFISFRNSGNIRIFSLDVTEYLSKYN